MSVNFIAGKNIEMHHIAFELRDFSHMHAACDLFGERKIPIIWGPVRLGPGHNVATFHRNHDDWVVEFYAELDQMKDEALGYFDPRPWHHDRPQRPKVWDRHEGRLHVGPAAGGGLHARPRLNRRVRAAAIACCETEAVAEERAGMPSDAPPERSTAAVHGQSRTAETRPTVINAGSRSRCPGQGCRERSVKQPR